MDQPSNVVSLPDRAVRSWAGVAEGLTAALIELGRDPDAVAKVVDSLRTVYIAAWEGPTINTGDPEGDLRRLNDWVTSFLLRLLLIAAEARLDLSELQAGIGGAR